MLVCKRCGEKLADQDKADRHMQYMHNTNHWDLNQGLKELKQMMKDLELENPRPLFCDKCNEKIPEDFYPFSNDDNLCLCVICRLKQ